MTEKLVGSRLFDYVCTNFGRLTLSLKESAVIQIISWKPNLRELSWNKTCSMISVVEAALWLHEAD